MNSRYRKYTIIGIIILIIAAAAGIVIHYFATTTAVTITSVNTKTVVVTERPDDTSTPKTVATLTKSPATIRIAKSISYVAQYTGSDGYASGSIDVSASAKNIAIDPDYSQQHYASLMENALPKVHTLLLGNYPTLDSLFTVSSAGMQQKAMWYVVRLDTKGDYSDNSDTLRALFKKDGDSWKLVSGPAILFTTTDYPNVDENVLKWANEIFVE